MKAKELASQYVPKLVKATVNDKEFNNVLKDILAEFMLQMGNLARERQATNKRGRGKFLADMSQVERHHFENAMKSTIQKYRAFARHVNTCIRGEYGIQADLLAVDGFEEYLKQQGFLKE